MQPASTCDLFAAIKSRRSVRSFQSVPVPPAAIEQLVDAARWAPTPSNLQTLCFVAVQDPFAISTLKALSPGFPAQGTSAIIVCSDRRKVRGCEGNFGRTIVIEEAAMAAQNIQLAAHGLSLGTCAVASFSCAGVRELIDLPEPVWPVLIVALGVPAAQPPAPERRAVAQLLSWEAYKEG